MKINDDRLKIILALQVAPEYRINLLSKLSCMLAPEYKIKLYSGDLSINHEVTLGKFDQIVGKIRLRRLPFSLFFFSNNILDFLNCFCLIIENNPRNLSAWFYLIARKLKKKRTIIWGHSSSRKNNSQRSKLLHFLLNCLADGILVYTEDEMSKVFRFKDKVWVAYNSLYEFEVSPVVCGNQRNSIVYSGRLEKSKEIDCLVQAFEKTKELKQSFTFQMIGDGSEKESLVNLVNLLGLTDRVSFLGSIFDYDQLKHIYSECIYAIAPGYGGLNMLQANWFGVPVLTDIFVKHAPEISIVGAGGIFHGDFSDIEKIASSLDKAVVSLELSDEVRLKISHSISSIYNISNMAESFRNAIFAFR